MKRYVYDFVANKNNHKFRDVDFHDFIEMYERGMSETEISKELGVPKSYVKKLVNDYRKNY